MDALLLAGRVIRTHSGIAAFVDEVVGRRMIATEAGSISRLACNRCRRAGTTGLRGTTIVTVTATQPGYSSRRCSSVDFALIGNGFRVRSLPTTLAMLPRARTPMMDAATAGGLAFQRHAWQRRSIKRHVFPALRRPRKWPCSHGLIVRAIPAPRISTRLRSDCWP